MADHFPFGSPDHSRVYQLPQSEEFQKGLQWLGRAMSKMEKRRRGEKVTLEDIMEIDVDVDKETP